MSLVTSLTPIVTPLVTSLATSFVTSVVATLATSLVMTFILSFITCLDAPHDYVHLPSRLSWRSCHDPTRVSCHTLTCFFTTSQSQNTLRAQRKRLSPPKARRGFTARSQHVHRATARAIRPTQSAQRVYFAGSKREPRNSENDSTHPKRAEGSPCVRKGAAPQPERFDPAQKVHFAC